MKERKKGLEIIVTAVLSVVLGFFLAVGAALDGGGYLGWGVEHAATNIGVPWGEPSFYLSLLCIALMVYVVLWLLWRALDALAAQRFAREQAACAANAEYAEYATGATGRASAAGRAGPPHPARPKKRWFWIVALLLLLCWLPYWLALWPGVFNYDGHYQYKMIAEGYLQTHHPLLHTFLLDGLLFAGQYFLGGVNTGLALFIGLQLVVCALSFSWMLYTLAQEGAGKMLLVASFLFLGINPAFVLWLVSTNKDVLFTVFLLLAILVVYRALRQSGEPQRNDNSEQAVQVGDGAFVRRASSPSATSSSLPSGQKLRPPLVPLVRSRTLVALFFLALGLLAFRTSAVYSLVVFLPCALLLVRKGLRARIVGTLGVATLTFIALYVIVVQAVFHVPSGPWQTLDALSLPRQQLARVYALTANDPSQQAAFATLFDKEAQAELAEYEADDADTSRKAFRTAFEEHPLELLSLYVTMGQAHPGAYADAVLLTAYEALVPGAVVDGYIYPGYFAAPNKARGSYLDASTFSPAEEAWILPEFGAWLQNFGVGLCGTGGTDDGSLLDLMPVRLLCSPAVYVWLVLIVCARMVCVRNQRGALVSVLLLLFTLTALLSPLVVMRYFLFCMAALPLLLHLAASPSLKHEPKR